MINKISSRVSIPLSSCSQEEDSFCVKHSSHWWNRKGMRIIRPCFSSLSDSKYKIPFVSISSNSSFSIWYSQYPCGEPDFCCPNSFLHVLILSRIHCYIGGSILDNSSFKQVKVDGRGELFDVHGLSYNGVFSEIWVTKDSIAFKDYLS